MFPLHQSDELLYQIFATTNQHKIPQDPITGHTEEEANPMAKTWPLKSCHMGASGGGGGCEGLAACDKYKKQKLHRETERQRRQDVASLYASLRSLLPGDYIKGKRSMSDHMNEAVNYIKHLEKKVKEIDAKRHVLKRVSGSASAGSGKTRPASNYCFIIRQSFIGIEIMFRCAFDDRDLYLSTVLSVLIDEGLPVASCVSTKSGEYLLHTIQTEVKDPTSISISRLQKKLNPKTSEVTK
ncbi:putative Basic helix-loop-helix DNA-binding superfamily protein [Hibiscus syriacus]|uniref:Basic helix-loop-helix DNA-binding superfamily protein n=1 Tax=Hibiscus syriacus TaxID=106335 RepID=A0A6A2WVU0_HIBSY|nr:transcription factor bHLH36-like [Hibiscus syriacus]KAE8665498.1 putative Basic helix-loop-helix DNA-binding superfamily protein [Hibiscus syriacus]